MYGGLEFVVVDCVVGVGGIGYCGIVGFFVCVLFCCFCVGRLVLLWFEGFGGWCVGCMCCGGFLG